MIQGGGNKEFNFADFCGSASKDNLKKLPLYSSYFSGQVPENRGRA
jgi:hypothetical protein